MFSPGSTPHFLHLFKESSFLALLFNLAYFIHWLRRQYRLSSTVSTINGYLSESALSAHVAQNMAKAAAQTIF